MHLAKGWSLDSALQIVDAGQNGREHRPERPASLSSTGAKPHHRVQKQQQRGYVCYEISHAQQGILLRDKRELELRGNRQTGPAAQPYLEISGGMFPTKQEKKNQQDD